MLEQTASKDLKSIVFKWKPEDFDFLLKSCDFNLKSYIYGFLKYQDCIFVDMCLCIFKKFSIAGLQ